MGTYAITGTLVEHTCGQTAFPAADPLAFEVELRQDGPLAYWVVQPPPRSGTMTEDGAFHFDAESSRLLMQQPVPTEPDPEFEADPAKAIDPERFDRPVETSTCVLVIRETIDGSVHRAGSSGDADGGVPAADLSGRNVIEVTPQAGAGCAFLTEKGEQAWEQLPCRVRYTLEGTRLDAEPQDR